MNSAEIFERAKAAVVTVGLGRGFVIECGESRYVLTAAHCLPTDGEGKLPFPAASVISSHERTFPDLLAPLGGKPAIWAECLFVDPVADIAVLGQPDCQELSEQAAAYGELVEAAAPITIADMPQGGHAWLLSLDGRWSRCAVCDSSQFHAGGASPLWLQDAAEPIKGGMSGSPVVSPEGAAIGIMCCSSGTGPDVEEHTDGGMNPRLVDHLPGWLLR